MTTTEAYWYADRRNLATVANAMSDADIPAREIARMIEKPRGYEAEWLHCNAEMHERKHCLLCDDGPVSICDGRR